MSDSLNMKVLAQTLGVSTSTISRTLSGQGRISADTRTRLLAQIQALGYAPNVNARRLVTGHSYTVAFKASRHEQPTFDFYTAELVGGIQALLQAGQYGLLLDTNSDMLLRWVQSCAIDGVILQVGYPMDTRTALEIARKTASVHVPAVILGHAPIRDIPGVGSVVIDLESGAREAARLLLANGHRRIAFVGTYAPNEVLTAFQAELGASRIALTEDNILVPGRSPEEGANAIRELLQRRERPTALFLRTDVLAAYALQVAYTLGLRVPQDVSIIGHDNVALASLTAPPLTTVSVNCVRICETAVNMLFGLLKQSDRMPEPQTVSTQLILRDTVAPTPF